MGHLSRGQAVAHSLGWAAEEVLFVSASPYAGRMLAGWAHQAIPADLAARPEDLRRWLEALLITENIKEIYLDTFPVGLWGEWNGPCSSVYSFYGVFRRLQWEAYEPWIVSPPRFRQSFAVEVLPDAFQDFVEQHSQEVRPLALQYPEKPLSQTQLAELTSIAKPLWLIVHSRPAEEVEALVEMALDQARLEGQQPGLLVLSQEQIDYPGIINRDWLEAEACFPYADRIFTAAGFNLIQQTRHFREKHHCLPFLRRYDDQFWRKSQTLP